MTQTPDPPEGSRFAMGRTGEGHYRISWPLAGCSGWERWSGAAFLAFWLCGWAVGEVFALSALAGMLMGWGEDDHAAGGCCASVFLVAWLGGWTIGGVAAARALYQLVRTRSRESVTLSPDTLFLEPGFLPPQNEQASGRSALSFTSLATRPHAIRRDQVAGGLRLDRVGERQRLTVDCGADRVEIGFALREPEREWLHRVLLAWLGPPDERVVSREERYSGG